MSRGDLQIRLLGPVGIRHAGDDLLLGSGRRAAVLAVLALEGGAALDRLVAAVWGDEPPASANGNLYTQINFLRTALGAEVVTRTDGVYRLEVPDGAVDALRFAEFRDEAGRHRAAGDRVAELASLSAGLLLWRGEALAGVPGTFAASWRTRLHELRSATERRRAELLTEPAPPAVKTEPGRKGEPGRNAEPAGNTVLRAVAFLGDGATTADISLVTGLPSRVVERDVAARRAAGVLTLTGGRVAFADPAAGPALRGGTPEALRSTLHAFFAEMIADAAGPPERVAAQLLLAGPAPLGPKVSRWLLEHIDRLALLAPAAAIELLQRTHLQHLPDRETHLALSIWLARLLSGHGRDAVAEAGWVAARTSDLDVQAEMLWIAARSHDGHGRPVAAAAIARSALGARRHTQPWLDRFRHLILRLRPLLPGEPTEPRHDRDSVVRR